MSDYNYQEVRRNASNTGWDNYYPVTKAGNVIGLPDWGPQGVYATVSALYSAHPTGNQNIYLVLDDGNWYYWTGSVWDAGGLYQSASISEELQQEIDNLKYKISNIELSFTNEFVTSANHASGAGAVVSDTRYRLSNIVTLMQGQTIRLKTAVSPNVLSLSKWTSGGVFVSGLLTGNDSIQIYEYTATDTVEYVRICDNILYLAIEDVFLKYIEDKGTILDTLGEKTNLISSNYDKISPQAIRKPVINFIFDDGNTSDASIVDTFKLYGFVCGFAILSDNTRVDEYLGYQDDGFEILSHSTDGVPMSDGTTDVSIIENKFKLSKQTLESEGFKITGWVTPSSELHANYLPALKKYYEYGYTDYLGLWEPTDTENPYNVFLEDTRRFKRVSMEETTTDDCKSAIDKAILDGGMLTFYAHENIDMLTTLLSYLRSKVDAGECVVSTPTECYKHYYSLRHDDVLMLLQ